MARLKVNPTRMELRRLKGRLKTAERGHKLLKDKSDEMIRRFMEIVGENKRLRRALEGEIAKALAAFSYAKAISDSAAIEEALALPAKTLVIRARTLNIMSLAVPKIELEPTYLSPTHRPADPPTRPPARLSADSVTNPLATDRQIHPPAQIFDDSRAKSADELFPYSFASVTAELDGAIAAVSGLIEKMVRLAEVEKTCDMLASEIEKNKRRVNALEYFMIPQIKETIKYIDMKLQENERGNTVRLMKVKEMLK